MAARQTPNRAHNDNALGDDHQRLQAQRELQNELKRLEHNQLLQERLLKKGETPCKQPAVETLLKQAGQLEDAGRLEDASTLYEKALSLEPGNHELRQYIQRLAVIINSKRIDAKARSQRNEFVRASLEDRFAGLSLPLHSQEQPRKPLRNNVGMPQPVAPEDYREQLRQQAEDRRRLAEEQRRKEKLLEAREMQVNQRLHSVEQHEQVVRRGDDKLAHMNHMKAAKRDKRQERIDRFYLENQPAPELFPPSPLAGVGARDRLVDQVAQQARQQRLKEFEQYRAGQYGYNGAGLRGNHVAAGAGPREAWSDNNYPSSSSSGQQQQPYMLHHGYSSSSGGNYGVDYANFGQGPTESYDLWRAGPPSPGGPSRGPSARPTSAPYAQAPKQQHHYQQQDNRYQQLQAQAGRSPVPAAQQGIGRRLTPEEKQAEAERQRQARYPGVRRKDYVRAPPPAPYYVPEVEAPRQAVDVGAMRAAQARFYEKHAKREVQGVFR